LRISCLGSELTCEIAKCGSKLIFQKFVPERGSVLFLRISFFGSELIFENATCGSELTFENFLCRCQLTCENAKYGDELISENLCLHAALVQRLCIEANVEVS